jgi:excisionase family DNA binding protein
MNEELARLKSGLLTVAEVAKALRISRNRIYSLIHGGELGAIRVGGVFRVPEAELLAYMKRNATKTAYEED